MANKLRLNSGTSNSQTVCAKVQKEPTVTCLQALSWNLSGRNKENHVQSQQYSVPPVAQPPSAVGILSAYLRLLPILPIGFQNYLVRFNVCRVLNKVYLKNYCSSFLLLCLHGLLKMETVKSSETLVGLNFYQTTMHRIPEASSPDSRVRDKPQFSRTLWVLFLSFQVKVYGVLGIVS
jgi:hypothetical protein